MELRAERGRAVLVGAPELFQPPTALAGALDEWAEVAHAVCSDDDTDRATAELVSARGRQLAARLAEAAGTPVGYADPVLGVVEHVPPTPSSPWPDTPDAPAEVPGWAAPDEPAGWAAVWAGPGDRPDAAPAEPTPWATGLIVSAFAAVVVLAAVVTLVRGLAEVTWLLGAIGLIVVTGGLAPSIWLARHTPLWRWVGFGVAAGIAISWVAVLLATLGP